MRARYFAVVVTVCAIVAQPAAAKFHYTHRITVVGQITDHWTVTDPTTCGTNGDGTFTATFHTTSKARVFPFITPYSSQIRGRGEGRWVMGVPAGGGVGDLGPRPVAGTVTTVDNTVKGPNTNNPDVPCDPDDKSGCGTAPLARGMAKVTGYDRRSILLELRIPHGLRFNPPQDPAATRPCRIGSLESWSEPTSVVGGVPRYGDLIAKMPKQSKLAHTRAVTVTGTTHRVLTTVGFETITDDVTRTVTVTFTRL